jgi:heat-inducible transcriptional repressor
LKTLTTKRFPKKLREKRVLHGLVELFISTAKPVGSNTLKDHGFDDLSSATIRNYFSKLEKEGYLEQLHSSGGRIPTEKAFKDYAKYHLDKGQISHDEEKKCKEALSKETKEVNDYLHSACDFLSELCDLPVLFTPPKIDVDLIQAIKLFPLKEGKILCIIVSDLGSVRTEIFYPTTPFSYDALTQIENYIYWKLNKANQPMIKDDNIIRWAKRIHAEIMVRHFIASSAFTLKHLGVSKLLSYPEFFSSDALAQALAFFEEKTSYYLLEKALEQNQLHCNLGKDLHRPHLSAITIPYYIGQTPAGVIALLGPMRLPYPKLFGRLITFSRLLSETLTRSAVKYKIAFKNPTHPGSNPSILLENKGPIYDR